MAQRLRERGTRAPRPRTRDDLPGEGYLFPGEVAEMLGCRDIDYRQLRRLFRLVRTQAGAPVRDGKWARFTLKDVAALRVALDLSGGSSALERGKHLQVAPLEHACRALRAQGVSNPLLDVPMKRSGTVVFAEIDGVLFDPLNGQLTLKDSRDVLQRYVEDHLANLDAEARGLTQKQLAAVRRDRTKLRSALAGEAASRGRIRDAARGRGDLRLAAPRGD